MSERDQDLEDRIAQELKGHEDPDFAWGRWYCSCGVRLRRGHTEMSAHRSAVEQKMREKPDRG